MASSLAIPVDNAGQALLELLRQMGVKYFFGNAGSDFTMIIDAFARFEVEHKTHPAPIQVPHETCAMNMAHGYYLASGEPPVVMVHSTVGTGNALCGLINAARANVPIILLAGRPPINETGNPGTRDITIHWSQEAFDQGEMVRQFTKWDYELRNFDQLETVIRRAFAIAMSEPRGPVYLTLPRDVMTENPRRDFIITRDTNQFFATATPQPDSRELEQVAELLADAHDPLIITRSFGRQPNGLEDLVSLADSFAIPVVEFEMPDCVNFPGNHPLHQGFDPAPLVAKADVILVLDCPMPWSPKFTTPRSGTAVIHLGSDPMHSRIPIWGFSCSAAIAGSSSTAVRILTKLLSARRAGRTGLIKSRFEALEKQHRANRPQNSANLPAGTSARVMACLNEFKAKHSKEMTFVHEYDLGMPGNRQQIEFNEPGSCFAFGPSGGLGFGVGGALGVKLARPDTTVVSVVGDGTYVLGAAIASHMVSAANKLPILWVVCNNHGWAALALFTQLVQQNGWWKEAKDFPLVQFGCVPRYEQICRACGGWGEAVEDLEQLPGALDRALHIVRHENKQALLNVQCGPPFAFTPG